MTRCFLVIAMLGMAAPCLLGGEMDGEWVSLARVRGGDVQAGEPSYAVILDGKFSTKHEGVLTGVGDLKEVAETSPSHYSIHVTGDGEDKGKSFHGIFAVSGDLMITCANPTPEGGPPTKFVSTKENQNILVVWIRKSAASSLASPTAEPGGSGEDPACE